MTAPSDRLQHAIGHAPGSDRPGDVHDLLTEGYAQALALDAERLRLERQIGERAERADDPGTAQELRSLWLRQRSVTDELADLRAMLERLRERQAA